MLIKICGLTRQEDLSLAAELHFDFAGFIFYPKSPRYIDPGRCALLDSGKLKRVGVFVDQDVDTICRVAEVARLDYVQLHGKYGIDEALKIGSERVIRVLWPERYGHRATLYKDLITFADSCAFFLFDAGVNKGGSGIPFDWELIAGITFPKPWFLAGGLSPRNIDQVYALSPAGLDVNSGVESSAGIKDAEKMKALAKLVQK